MNVIFRFTALLFLVLSGPIVADGLKVIGPQSEIDVAQGYYYDLLSTALANSHGDSVNLELVDASGLSQGRMLQLLENGFIDVYWTGTTVSRETNFLAIRVPLMRGLLGYRVSIIREENQDSFINMPISALKEKVACQGEHWPDTKILSFNQFSVAPVALYKRMFEMVSLGRCDYFPRAIFEAYGELTLARIKSPNLTVYDDRILYYPFPIYFFVRKGENVLATRIESGLEAMIASGEFDAFMMEHPLTQGLYPLDKWQDKHIVTLENPLLPHDTPTHDPKLFIRL